MKSYTVNVALKVIDHLILIKAYLGTIFHVDRIMNVFVYLVACKMRASLLSSLGNRRLEFPTLKARTTLPSHGPPPV